MEYQLGNFGKFGGHIERVADGDGRNLLKVWAHVIGFVTTRHATSGLSVDRRKTIFKIDRHQFLPWPSVIGWRRRFILAAFAGYEGSRG
jgi:hypothetical protein